MSDVVTVGDFKELLKLLEVTDLKDEAVIFRSSDVAAMFAETIKDLQGEEE